MNRKLQSLTGLVLGALLLVAGNSCSKKDDKPASKTELLTSQNWKLIAFNFHGDFDGDGVQDAADTNIFALLEACEKDDFIKFNTGGTGNSDEGASKCDAADPQTSPINWAFKENETIINITEDSIPIDFKILELTATTLKVQFTDTISGSGDVYTMTYTH